MIRAFIKENKLLLLLIIIFIIAEAIVNPLEEFPLNDDWTYTKSVKIFLEKGIIDIGDFPAMTLFTHLLWGSLFAKIFGFSFVVLRLSTLFSAIISIIILNKIIVNGTGNKLMAFMCGLVFLFNPIYFNLSNTFMTDVNFITLLLLSIHFALNFFRTQSIIYFIGVFFISVLIVLIRQYGIIVPVCFSFTCLFLKNKRLLYTCFAIALTIAVIAIFKYYEAYLKTILPENAAYKFSNKSEIGTAKLWQYFYTNIKSRYAYILLYLFIFCFPFVAIFLKNLFEKFSYTVLTGIIVISGAVCYFLFREVVFPFGNIFENGMVGPETFFQTFKGDYHHESHNYSQNLVYFLSAIKYIFSTGTLVYLILMVTLWVKEMQRPFIFNVHQRFLFLGSLFFSYIFMLMITNSFFDRYNLPLIIIFLIVFSFLSYEIKVDNRSAMIPLLIFFYIGVFGTKDYFEVNRTRWEAYHFITNRLGAHHSTINAGFEPNCWNEGHATVWYYFTDVYAYTYLIQYNREPDFKSLREYEFQRYFPYRKDKIFIFMNLRKARHK